jgi:bifunctional enzyme CysN/CysC
MRQKPCMLWFTGLSGAGKSTIANLVEKRSMRWAIRPICSMATMSATGSTRTWASPMRPGGEHPPRRRARKLMVDAGLIVLVSFISPFRSERLMARELVEAGEFIEVFVDTPLALAETRDPKGLYAKARRGEIANFTGISSPYETPEDPEIRIDTAHRSAEEAAGDIVGYLDQAGRLSGQ